MSGWEEHGWGGGQPLPRCFCLTLKGLAWSTRVKKGARLGVSAWGPGKPGKGPQGVKASEGVGKQPLWRLRVAAQIRGSGVSPGDAIWDQDTMGKKGRELRKGSEGW